MKDFFVERYHAFMQTGQLQYLLLIVLSILIAGSAAGVVLALLSRRRESLKKTAENFNSRVRSWWIMCGIFMIALASGGIGSIVLFMLTSFLALREFIAVVPTRRSDHRTLVWCFWVILPLQYFMVLIGWYGMFVLLIPLYAFLFIPMRNVIAGDCENFLERTSKIQGGLTACVYCVSHAPMLLTLKLNFPQQGNFINAQLLFFLVTVVEMSDVLQYCWGKSCGKHKILPAVSPNKTVEGFIGGVLSAALLGVGLSFFTPFNWYQGGLIALAAALAGFAGDVTMSAIKRDCGVKDYGTALAGHGGVLDRIDSLCFAAPVFFHIVRYYFVD